MRRYCCKLAAGLALTIGILLCGHSPSRAATASEILQKAIYAEESVGNLDEAIKLYEQVIAEGKSARNAAAQAQYRIALIYLKQNKKTEANAALEKLVKDYPDEKELVAQARQRLPGEFQLSPAPWNDHEALQLNMKLANGLDTGTMLYRMDSAQHEGKEVWRCTGRVLQLIGPGHSYSTVLATKDSFAPIFGHWNLNPLGDIDAIYKTNSVELKDLNKNTTREVPVKNPIFDNEQAAQLIRRLPLAVGYKSTLPIFPTITGQSIDLELTVLGKELVEVPAGKFECFKLNLSLVNQSFYYTADEHRYLVKIDASPATVELNRIFSFEPGQSTKFETDGYTITLPADWFSYTGKPSEPSDLATTYLLNTNSVMMSKVIAGRREKFNEGARPKAWLDSEIKRAKKNLTAFAVRDGSEVESTIAGQPAVSFVADFTEGGKKMVFYVTGVFAEKQAVTFRAAIEASNFDAYRKELDKVIASVQLKQPLGAIRLELKRRVTHRFGVIAVPSGSV